MASKRITRSKALDLVLSAFTRRGWRDEGEAARAVVDAAAASSEPLDLDHLADVVPRAFLVNNDVQREQVRAAITSVLGGMQVQAMAADSTSQPVIVKATTNQRINITSSGPWIGNVGGGGDITEAKQAQQQLTGDAAIEALAARFSGRPDVQEIILETPAAKRHPRLTTWLRTIGGVAEDLAAKVASELIKSQMGR